MFTEKMKNLFINKKGYNVKIYTLDNLSINEKLLSNDFFILKSKNIFFIYAGQFLKANKIPVIPDPDTSFKQKNRVHSYFLIKKAGLSPPHIYLSTVKTLKKELNSNDFPLILKPIMGSGSKGVKLVKALKDLRTIGIDSNKIVYLEQFIEGEHYNVYFIGNEICTLIKPPLSNEHVNMEVISTPNDIERVILKWKNLLGENAFFGHLDIVRKESNNKLYVVDPGSFPEFTNWKCSTDPVSKICNYMIERINSNNN